MAYLYSYKTPPSADIRARVEADEIATSPAPTYGSDEQRTDDNGNPLWVVDGLMPDYAGRAQPGTVYMTHALRAPAQVAERKFIRLKNAYHVIRAGKPYMKNGSPRSGGVVIDVYCDGMIDDREGK